MTYAICIKTCFFVLIAKLLFSKGFSNRIVMQVPVKIIGCIKNMLTGRKGFAIFKSWKAGLARKRMEDKFMEDRINPLISVLVQEECFSAEGLNALHGATAGHPWCEGKSEARRAKEVVVVSAGRSLSKDGLTALYKVERLLKQLEGKHYDLMASSRGS